MTTIIRQTPTQRDWEELIERSSEPRRRQRGIRYVEEGHVRYVQILHHEAQAVVQGKEPEPYFVSISLPNGLAAPDDAELDANCTCQDSEWICKHVVALMTVLGQRAAQQHPDQDLDYDQELDDYTTPPERLEPTLPQGEADFWGPGPAATKQYTTAGIHLLDQLGNLPQWSSRIRFGPLMRTIYRDASQAALTLLGEPTQPKEQNSTADQADHTPPPTPHQRAAKKSAKKPKCQCPYCVYERNERNQRRGGFQEPARDDTIEPGTYVDYLLKNNYEWSPCGRRMQPSNSISFKPEDEDEDEYEDEYQDEYEE